MNYDANKQELILHAALFLFLLLLLLLLLLLHQNQDCPEGLHPPASRIATFPGLTFQAFEQYRDELKAGFAPQAQKSWHKLPQARIKSSRVAPNPETATVVLPLRLPTTNPLYGKQFGMHFGKCQMLQGGVQGV